MNVVCLLLNVKFSLLVCVNRLAFMNVQDTFCIGKTMTCDL